MLSIYNLIPTSLHDSNKPVCMIPTTSLHDSNNQFTWFQKPVYMIPTTSLHYSNNQFAWFQPIYNMIPTNIQHDSNQFTTWFQPIYNMIPTSLQHDSDPFLSDCKYVSTTVWHLVTFGHLQHLKIMNGHLVSLNVPSNSYIYQHFVSRWYCYGGIFYWCQFVHNM